MESKENVIKLFEEGDKIVKNKSNGITHIFLEVDKPVNLLGFGIFGRTSDNLSDNPEDNKENCMIYLENNQLGKDLYEDEVTLEHDGTTKTQKIMYPYPLLLKEKTTYAFGVLSCKNEVERYNGSKYKEEIICDGVKFTIFKCVYTQLINSIYFERAEANDSS